MNNHTRNKQSAIDYIKADIRYRKAHGIDTDYPEILLKHIEEDGKICECYIAYLDCVLSDLVYFEDEE